MSNCSETTGKKIEINDLAPEETLSPEEKEQLAGAGRFRPSFEALEERYMMSASPVAPPAPPPTNQPGMVQPLNNSNAATSSGITQFHGASNASAALPMANGRVWVGDDKVPDRLRLYDANTGALVSEWKFPKALGNVYDIEGVTRVGNIAYWTTSGGKGNDIVFATLINADGTISQGDAGFLGKVSGFQDQIQAKLGNVKVYSIDANQEKTLAEAMTSSAKDKSWYNIEGIVMKPGETTAYFALRAPLATALGADGQHEALLIPVLNFKNLFPDENRNAPTADVPEIGTAFTTIAGLGGRGIRDIVYHAEWNKFVVLGGNSGKSVRVNLTTALYVVDDTLTPGGAATVSPKSYTLDVKDPTPDKQWHNEKKKDYLVDKDHWLSFEAIGQITGNLADGTAKVHLLADDGSSNTHGKEDINGKPISEDKQLFNGMIYSIK